eukprot:comp22567_c0_seq1/m.34403 comp22567_c0_seq1/g.34403  ORF comp22567_c0_seq1/g.34403 comp22567_c0_seq1/m.34403 type:complete len:179 (+) comp22567_c0_seq1:339-875(+)
MYISASSRDNTGWYHGYTAAPLCAVVSLADLPLTIRPSRENGFRLGRTPDAPTLAESDDVGRKSDPVRLLLRLGRRALSLRRNTLGMEIDLRAESFSEFRKPGVSCWSFSTACAGRDAVGGHEPKLWLLLVDIRETEELKKTGSFGGVPDTWFTSALVLCELRHISGAVSRGFNNSSC